MTTQTTQPDVFATWKELYDRFEGSWTTSMQEVLNSESFAAGMGLTREQYLNQKEMTREGMETYWQNLHLPTKADLAGVAELVVGLENRIENLEDQLEVMTDRFQAVSAQLEQVMKAIAGVGQQVSTLAVASPKTSPAPVAVIEKTPSVTSAPKAAPAAKVTPKRTTKK